MQRAHLLFPLLACAAVSALAADAFWNSKPIPNWTEDDAKQILNDSPWSKTIKAGLSRIQSEDERRDGGNMGQPHGVGYDGVDKEKTPLPNLQSLIGGPGANPTRATAPPVTLKLRWETALPVRAAELKVGEVEPPTSEGDGYRLAVYGVPGKYFKGDPKKLGEPLKKDALLKREGKPDVRATQCEVFQTPDGLVVVYLFPLSAEISKRDGLLTFEAAIGRILVFHPFDLSQMQFQGKLEL